MIAVFYLISIYQIKPDSANGRILIWLASIKMFVDNSLFGVGYGNFGSNYLNYQIEAINSYTSNFELFKGSADDTRYAFNDFFQSFAETGIIGGICFITLVISNIVYLIKKIGNSRSENDNPWHSACYLGIILTIVFAGFSSYPLQNLPISVLFWITLAICAPFYKISTLHLNKKVFISILMFFGIGYGYYCHRRTDAYLKFNSIISSESSETLKLQQMETIYPILKDRSSYLIYFSELYKKRQDLGKSIYFMEEAAKFSPSKDVHYTLGDYYLERGDTSMSKRKYHFVEQAIPGLLTPKYLTALVFYKSRDTMQFLNYSRTVLDFQPKIFNQRVVDIRRDLKRKIESFEGSASETKTTHVP